MDDAQLRVLLVDDDPDQALMFRRTAQRGFGDDLRIDHAISSNEANTCLRKNGYDVLFVDYRMPGEDGLELLQRLRADGVHTPVVMLTGQGDEKIAVQAMRAGATDYLPKSRLDEASLRMVVRLAVDTARREALVEAAQQRAHEIEKRFRALVENSHEAVLLLSPNGVVQFASISCLRVLGRPAERLERRRLVRLVHPEDANAFERVLNNVLAEQPTPMSFSCRIAAPRRNWRHVEGTLVNRLADNAVRAIVVNLRDVTLQRAAEDALVVSNVTLRTLFEASPLAVIAIDLGDRTTVWNQAAESMFGWRAEDVMGRTNPVLSRQALADARLGAMFHLSLLGTRVTGVECRRAARDGHMLEVSLSAAPLRDARGAITGFMAILSDISAHKRDAAERRQVLESLRKSEERFQLAARATQDVFWDYDVTIGSLWWGDGVERVFGWHPEELDKLSKAQAITHPDDFENAVEGFASVLHSSENCWSAGCRWRRKDGTYANVLNRGYIVRDEHGQAVRMIGAVADVSAHVRLQEQLTQAQKMDAIGRLAGGIAHDFNNLLMVISSYAELLVDALPPGDRMHRNTEQIVKACRRAGSLTQQLLAFGRKQVLSPRVLELNQLMREIALLLPRLVGEDIDLNLALADGSLKIKADPVQIEQVLLNLGANARDAMPHGGRLTLETSVVSFDVPYRSLAPGHYVMLAVSDTGEGMDKETLSRVFEPFYTTKDKGKGTGLGLATVYGIVQQSGGEIYVYSELGQGTTFKLYFPLCEQPVRPSTPAVSVNEGRGRETILLVEDEEGVRESAREYLEMRGYRVLVAANGCEALALASRAGTHIDMLISDVIMPGMGGRDVACRMREADPDLHVLFISGYTEATVSQQGVIDLPSRFLQKPFTLSALVAKMREVLDTAPADGHPVEVAHE